MKLRNTMSIITLVVVSSAYAGEHRGVLDIWHQSEECGKQFVTLCAATNSFEGEHRKRLETVYQVEMKKYRDTFNSWGHYLANILNSEKPWDAHLLENKYKKGSFHYEDGALENFYSTMPVQAPIQCSVSEKGKESVEKHEAKVQEINERLLVEKLSVLNSIIPIAAMLNGYRCSVIAQNQRRLEITKKAGIKLDYPAIAHCALRYYDSKFFSVNKDVFYYVLQQEPNLYTAQKTVEWTVRSLSNLEYDKARIEIDIKSIERKGGTINSSIQEKKERLERQGTTLLEILNDVQKKRKDLNLASDHLLLHEELKCGAPQPTVVKWFLDNGYNPNVIDEKGRMALDVVIYNAAHHYDHSEIKFAKLGGWGSGRPRALCAALLAKNGAKVVDVESAIESLEKEIAVLDKKHGGKNEKQKANLNFIIDVLKANGNQEVIDDIYNKIKNAVYSASK